MMIKVEVIGEDLPQMALVEHDDVVSARNRTEGRSCVVTCFVKKNGYSFACSGSRVAYTLPGGLAVPVAAPGHTLDAREEATRDVG